MTQRYDCDHELGLDTLDRARLGGFSLRAMQALAHLREAWCQADAQNRVVVEAAIQTLLASHTLRTHYALCFKVLASGLDDPAPLVSAVTS